MVTTKLLYVVDDDEIFHFIIKKLLGQQEKYRQNLTIASFLSAEDALEQLHNPGNAYPSLIILDMNMHSMDGWGFIDNYRAMQAKSGLNIPIIMCSSSMDIRDIQKVEATPELAAYITKPLDNNKLKIIEGYL
jgi:CheY-like chemotaxis protein